MSLRQRKKYKNCCLSKDQQRRADHPSAVDGGGAACGGEVAVRNVDVAPPLDGVKEQSGGYVDNLGG